MSPEAPLWIAAWGVFDGARLLPDHAIRLQGGHVAELAPVSSLPPGQALTRLDGVIAPGFVDLQVNGGGGVLLNQTPTREGIATLLAAHRRFGTVAVLPTVITDAPDVLEAAAEAVLQAWDLPGLLGLHIEGPHISLARRGTHSGAYIRPFDSRTLDVVARLRAADLAVMVTLAPEAATPEDVAALARLGAVISIGHSDATAEQVGELLDAGAGCFTHLFNAMSQMTGRAPGVVGAALNSQAKIGIICDGVHVSDAMVGLACRACPGQDQMFLVSDAMPTVGGPDRFTLYGQTITVQDGRLINAEGSLAGAHTTMAEGVARLVGPVGLPLERALRMAITLPAATIGAAPAAGLLARPVRDIVCLSRHGVYRGPLSADISGLGPEGALGHL